MLEYIRPKKYIVGLLSDQSSTFEATMWFFCFVFQTLLYLMDYFNNVLKRPSMKLAGTSMPFCKWWCSKFILHSIYFENQWDSHEYLMQCGNISGMRKIRIFLYIDVDGSKSMHALTRDQQYIFFRLIIYIYIKMHSTHSCYNLY